MKNQARTSRSSSSVSADSSTESFRAQGGASAEPATSYTPSSTSSPGETASSGSSTSSRQRINSAGSRRSTGPSSSLLSNVINYGEEEDVESPRLGEHVERAQSSTSSTSANARSRTSSDPSKPSGLSLSARAFTSSPDSYRASGNPGPTSTSGFAIPSGSSTSPYASQSLVSPPHIPREPPLATGGGPQPIPIASSQTSYISSSPQQSSVSSPPGAIGPHSLPGSTSVALPSPGSAAAVRVSTTPFLPSPLAQASLAPGEEGDDTLDFIGLDDDTISPKETRGESGYTGISLASLRRSASTSYKGSASRRRISVTSQSSSGSVTGSPPASSGLPSSNTGTTSGGRGASGSISGQSSTTGMPSPLRREASLLGRSRDYVSVTPEQSSSYAAPSATRPVSTRHILGMSSSSLSSSISGYSDQFTPYQAPAQNQEITPAGSPAKAKVSPTSSLSSRQSSSYAPSVRPASTYQFPPPSGHSPGGSGPSVPSSSLLYGSPPRASPLATSASSPGIDSRNSGSSRLAGSSGSMSRGTHGRSESLSGVLAGGSDRSYAAPTSSATSPTTALRTFPSAPPLIPGISPASSFSLSHSHTGQTSKGAESSLSSSAVSPYLKGGLSPPSSVSSVGSTKPDGSPAQSAIKLQRVPTSVRLAQDLHPAISPSEKRRTSVDAGLATSLPRMGGAGKFAMGAARTASSSSTGNSSETEGRDDDNDTLAIPLPPTPAATRQNTPSPGYAPQALSGETEDYSADHSRLLASPFIVSDASEGTNPGNNNETKTMPISDAGPNFHETLSPFSLPSASLSALGQSRPASQPASRSPSLSRSRVKGSPLFHRLSPRMNQDPFGQSPPSTDHTTITSSVPAPAFEEIVSPLSSTVPQGKSTAAASSPSTLKRIRTLDNATVDRRKDLLEAEASLASLTLSDLGRTLTHEAISPSASGSLASDRKKMFRTSMLPPSANVTATSSDDYARHLQESRASKLRKWAGASGPAIDNETIGGSEISSAKNKRRGGIPDFAGFGYSGSPSGQRDMRDELLGDLGARPGTSGSREIEWVDWLDEYKRMKEAKIQAEQAQRDLEMVDQLVENSPELQLEAEDQVATSLTSSPQGRGAEDFIRRNSKDKATVAFPSGSPSREESEQIQSGQQHRRRLSGSSVVSLGFKDSTKGRRTSQDSLSAIPSQPAAAPQKRALPSRSAPYAPSSSMQGPPPASVAGAPVIKKKRNLGAKIDAWWSAVTKSFVSTPATPATPDAPASRGGTGIARRPDAMKRVTSDISALAKPAAQGSRLSGDFSRMNLVPPKPALRHASSTSDLTPERGLTSHGRYTAGALAPAANVDTQGDLPVSQKPPSTSDKEEGLAIRGDQKRRNPQLSLRLDPRYKPAGTVHRLSDKGSDPSRSSQSSTSGSGGQLQTNLFKEPRLPGKPQQRLPEDTPSLTPEVGGRSPIWAQTPGLVPVSQHTAMRMGRSASKSSGAPKAPQTSTTLAPTFSMSHIRDHIKHRLTGAKDACDKELRKIINGITLYVENELENERAFVASGVQSRHEEENAVESINRHTAIGTAESDADNEEGEDVDVPLESNGLYEPPSFLRRDTDSSSSAGPSHLGSPSTALQQQRYPSGSGRGRTSGGSSPRRISLQPRRYTPSMPVKPADLAARLEESLELSRDKSIHPVSAGSSRSQSRSRSPMQALKGGSSKQRTSSAEWYNNHRTGRQTEDADKQHFLSSLQSMVSIALEILETSVADLTADPSTCAELIRRVQKVGKRWDDHPNWPLRGWYVQLLLAVAGLSRVSEFWAEERGFWNFEDDKEDTSRTPITFMTKPELEEDISQPSTSARSRAPSVANYMGKTASRQDSESMPSPLGIDLGTQRMNEDPPTSTRISVTLPSGTPLEEEQFVINEADVLREAVEEVRNATILMELQLDGESFQYLSPVWTDVVGLDTAECLGKPISHLLHPDDISVFAEATTYLLNDDSHTIEAHFRLRTFCDDENEDIAGGETANFESLEGKGMLIRDRLTSNPSHTMWVVRPATASLSGSDDGEATTVKPGQSSHNRAWSEPITPFQSLRGQKLSVQPVLCRICDKQIPTWFFEKHNETCNETHRLEVDISDCNDRVVDLRSIAASLAGKVKSASASLTSSPHGLEYGGIPLMPSRFKDVQIKLLDELLEILNTAVDVSTPSLSEDGKPIRDQRLLSPNSEDHLVVLKTWHAPPCEDEALRQLALDVAALVSQKIMAVNRLRNTLIYVERIRVEWESQADAVLASVPEEQSQSPPPSPAPTLSATDPSCRVAQTQEASNQATPIPNLVPKFSSDDDGKASAAPSPNMTNQSSPLSLETNSFAGLLSPLPLINQPVNTGATAHLDNNISLQSLSAQTALSPKVSSAVPHKSGKTSSIKDFEVIKPISKGAFGSVYLAKKRTTGDYYAIKVLKKADMIAKNQVTNVKAERKILMTQADSDFAVKLYWTFQSKDYLYLVMEYLNGGDCAALIKVMGALDEQWAKSYIAEITLGLEYLHSRGIVHRDLKPDNLLIDSRGHLRLTDFGLSRFGLLGRQARAIQQQPPVTSGKRLKPRTSRSMSRTGLSRKNSGQYSLTGSANFSAPSGQSTPDSQPRASYFGSMFIEEGDLSESSGSESVAERKKRSSRLMDSPAVSMDSGNRLAPPVHSPGQGSDNHRFVGTVDYVAPESILGMSVGEGVDWWSLGVICHEFLTAYPPFHAPTPDQVFDNILSRRIDWHEDEVEMSAEARDFINRLLCFDSSSRLGANGAEEVKRHPWLADIDWKALRSEEANFVPQVQDPESTDYFDARGATDQLFVDDLDNDDSVTRPDLQGLRTESDPMHVESLRDERDRRDTGSDDFGTFAFKNLDVLKQANDDLIKKLRDDHVLPSPGELASRNKAEPSARKAKAKRSSMGNAPPSPSASTTSSMGSGLSRPSAPSTPQGIIHHSRRPSEHQTLSKTIAQGIVDGEQEHYSRRNSMPSRLRRSSFSTHDKRGSQEASYHQRRRTSGYTDFTPASSVSSPASAKAALPPVPPLPADLQAANASGVVYEKTVDCLIAEDNPISSKILETILLRLGCLCVVVQNGEEAIRCSMGEIAFDVIFMDMLMPILDGENAARMIKSTNNANQNTPIVAVTSYAAHDQLRITEEGTLFNAVLTKPVNKKDVLDVLSKLGFIAKTKATSQTPSAPHMVTQTSAHSSHSPSAVSVSISGRT